MEGYFNIKIKFVVAVLLAVLFYVSYLYLFKEQTPTAFVLNKDCTTLEIKEGAKKANLFFERYYEEETEQKIKWRLSKEKSDYAAAQYSLNKKSLEYLKDSILLINCLDETTNLSAHLLKNKLELALESYLVDLERKEGDGTDFYAFKLKEQGETTLTADEIYKLGEEEVKRIHAEMSALLTRLNYKGDLQGFFTFLRVESPFYDLNQEEEMQTYINKVEESLAFIKPKLEQFFTSKIGEENAIDLVRDSLRRFPKYMADVMISYDLFPGKYLQTSVKNTLIDLPKFRQLGKLSTAYANAWAMYATYLSKEMGVYQEPYADFGRLSLELWTACHLVVDVGIHKMEWTKAEAINYYKKNTPNQELECLKIVEHHIALPAELITHKMGMITILELRKRTELALGEQFDLRKFHEVLLVNGEVPLDVLQDLVDAYINSVKKD